VLVLVDVIFEWILCICVVALQLFLPETVEFILGEKVAIVLQRVTLCGYFSSDLIIVIRFENSRN
jgi:hypothetical protein